MALTVGSFTQEASFIIVGFCLFRSGPRNNLPFGVSFLSQSVLIFVEFKLNVGGAITLSLAYTLWGNDSANIVSSCHFCSSLSYAGFLDGKLCQHSLSLCGLLNFNWTSAECDSTSSIREFTRTCSNGKDYTDFNILRFM